jgi:hypothetical protein
MTTRRRAFLAAAALAAFALAELASGQGGGQPDTAFYRDRKKDGQVATARGDLKESAAGIQVVVNGKVTLTLSPADVMRVEYSKLTGVSDNDRLRLANLEGKDVRTAKDAVATRSAYTDLIKSAGADPKTRKFLDFREAIWAARTADMSLKPEEFAAEAKPAIDKLVNFSRGNPKTWEAWPTGTTAARLQAETDKPNDAASTLSHLAKTPDLPAELRYEAQLAELDVMFRANRLAAESIAGELAADKGFPASGPAREKLAIYQAILKAPAPKEGSKPAEVRAAEEVIAKSADPSVKAVGHNVLGEYYLANNRPREAMWEYLWVATVHNQDKEEVVKAIRRLIEVGPKAGQPDVADKFRERLPAAKAALYTRES